MENINLDHKEALGWIMVITAAVGLIKAIKDLINDEPSKSTSSNKSDLESLFNNVIRENIKSELKEELKRNRKSEDDKLRAFTKFSKGQA